MANVMSLKGLRNKPSRNGFDLSRKNCFTAKAGELLPVMVEECIPGDVFKIRAQWFTRTQPANSAAYTRIREYYDFFFVPIRMLWRWFPNFVTQMDNTQSASGVFNDGYTNKGVGKFQPYIATQDLVEYYMNELKENNYTDLFGVRAYESTRKLLQYLDYRTENPKYDGTSYQTNVAINPFPILAYQKIWYDYYRNSQWQKSDPSIFNVDYLDGTTSSKAKIELDNFLNSEDQIIDGPFTLRYCNWNKDLFMGVLPSPQFGDTAKLSLSGDSVLDSPYLQLHQNLNQNLIKLNTYGTGNNKSKRIAAWDTSAEVNSPIAVDSLSGKLKFTNALSVIAIRQAEALQKWKEISLSGNEDYKAQISKHFGVDVPAGLASMCQFIGGCKSDLAFGEVVNTNLVDNTEGSAYIQGKGVSSGDGSINFEAKEHGILMCIYHALPLLDYSLLGSSYYNLKTQVTDYAIPEFDKIGMQHLSAYPLFGRFATEYLGYVPRYADYKTSIDRIHGEFRDSLSYWVTPLTPEYLYSFWNTETESIDYTFFKVHPGVLDSIFAVSATKDDGENKVWSADQFLINSFFNVKAVRNLDYNGFPY